MTEEQQRFMAEWLPAEADARIRTVEWMLNLLEIAGDQAVLNAWEFWKALTAEWARIKAALAADRKALQLAPAPVSNTLSA